ncbi:MAG: hypothetical protein IJ737_03035 [Ruminococcus sp.]|nr:hypothetical protein [Ruminococcus sp.]
MIVQSFTVRTSIQTNMPQQKGAQNNVYDLGVISEDYYEYSKDIDRHLSVALDVLIIAIGCFMFCFFGIKLGESNQKTPTPQYIPQRETSALSSYSSNSYSNSRLAQQPYKQAAPIPTSAPKPVSNNANQPPLRPAPLSPNPKEPEKANKPAHKYAASTRPSASGSAAANKPKEEPEVSLQGLFWICRCGKKHTTSKSCENCRDKCPPELLDYWPYHYLHTLQPRGYKHKDRLPRRSFVFCAL